MGRRGKTREHIADDESGGDAENCRQEKASSKPRGPRRGGKHRAESGEDFAYVSGGHQDDGEDEDAKNKQRLRGKDKSQFSPPLRPKGSIDNCTMMASFKCHHGKHLTVLPNGDLKATSSRIAEAEKFEMIRHSDGVISLKSCHGNYVTADRNGDLKATSPSIGDSQKFLMEDRPQDPRDAPVPGLISLQSHSGFYIAAQKSDVKANRRAAGAWETFQLKLRPVTGQGKFSRSAGESLEETQLEPSALDVAALPLFDACCELESVLMAEERYAKTHADKTSLAFAKKVRTRRAQGVEWSFKHFCDEQSYPASFKGCASSWDVTCSDLHWGEIQSETNAEVSIYSIFGVPAVSALEADEAAMDHLRRCGQLQHCVAIGPVSLDFSEPQCAAEPKEQHRGLTSKQIEETFGCAPPHHALPSSVYEAHRDPACLAVGGTDANIRDEWIAKHGDRRLGEFEATCGDYARRRLEVQKNVARQQIALAKELGKTLIIQLPPQDEAEKCMAEMLVEELGESGHPVLLSAFKGRPKCVVALLQLLKGLMVGFSGLLTHGKLRENLGEIAFDAPMDRFVLESLGPRYPPAVAGVGDARGSFSHPIHISLVAAELSKVKQVDIEKVLEAAWTNARRLYNLPVVDEAEAGCDGSRSEEDELKPEDKVNAAISVTTKADNTCTPR